MEPGAGHGLPLSLLEELDRRDGVFADVELRVTALDVGGDHACVEWTVEMTHGGPIVLADGVTIESSGLRVALHGHGRRVPR